MMVKLLFTKLSCKNYSLITVENRLYLFKNYLFISSNLCNYQCCFIFKLDNCITIIFELTESMEAIKLFDPITSFCITERFVKMPV